MTTLQDKIRDDIEAAQPLQFNDFKIKEFYVPSSGVFYHGLSSKYDTTFIDDLRGILSHDEFVGIVSRLNEIIQDYWPCNPCIAFGYCCYPCSYLPCFPTQCCINESEKHALDYLRRTNVRSLYFDRGINFSIDKGWCTSRLRITIPYALWLSVNKFPSNHVHRNNTSVGTSSPSRAAVVVASGLRTVDTISKTANAASVASANATITAANISIVHVSQPLAYQGTDAVRHMKGS